MKLVDKFKGLKPLKFQEGGVAPEQGAEQGAPQEDPQAQLMAAVDQALQSQDCELALQVLQVIQESLGGGQAPAPEQPTFMKGGIMKKKGKKKAMAYMSGGKMKVDAKKGKLMKGYKA